MTSLLDIGSKIKTARQRKQLSASLLAEKSRVHRNTVSALENGKGNVELNTLLALCEQLGLDIVLTPRETAAAEAGHAEQWSGLQLRIAERLARGRDGP